MHQLLFILETISCTSLILSSIFLGVAYVPQEEKIPNLKKSKLLIKLACVLLGVSGIILTTLNYQLADITFYTQIMAQTVSALLILSMILLLTKKFNTRKFIFQQTCLIAASISILYIYYYPLEGKNHTPIYYLLTSIYFIQILYYFFTYKHIFELWRNKKYRYTKYGKTIKRLWLILNLMACFVELVLLYPSKILFASLIIFYIVGILTFTILYYRVLILLNTTDFDEEKISGKLHEKGNGQKKLEEALKDWIENKNYLEKNITITTLAKQLGTNRTYLSNFINDRYHENFNVWLNRKRVQEAITLLETSNLSLHEVAEKVGYTDAAHFSKTFKTMTGQNPSMWRKETQNLV